MEDMLLNVHLLDIVNIKKNNVEVVVMNDLVCILDMHETVGRRYMTFDLLDIVSINMNNVEVVVMHEMAVILDKQDIVDMKDVMDILEVVVMVNIYQAQ